MRARHSDSAIAIALVALCSATVWAEAPRQHEPQKVAAVVTDASPVTPTPADVAREVVRLQEEMGGSITAGFGELPPWAPSQPAPPKYMPEQKSPLVTLREVVWQLEQAAHRLEMLDLYEQADTLRETAAILRGDARLMKKEGVKGDTAERQRRPKPPAQTLPGQSGDQK